MVGIVTAICMLMIEMVLYIIRTTELERYQPKRRRNEEMGQKGLTIPTADPLDDLQFWRMAGQGGRAEQRRKGRALVMRGTKTTMATASLAAAATADKSSSDSGSGGEDDETAAQSIASKDKDV